MKMNAMRRVPAPDGAIRIGNSRGNSQVIRGNSWYFRQFKLPARGQNSENTAILLAGSPPLKILIVARGRARAARQDFFFSRILA